MNSLSGIATELVDLLCARNDAVMTCAKNEEIPASQGRTCVFALESYRLTHLDGLQ